MGSSRHRSVAVGRAAGLACEKAEALFRSGSGVGVERVGDSEYWVVVPGQNRVGYVVRQGVDYDGLPPSETDKG